MLYRLHDRNVSKWERNKDYHIWESMYLSTWLPFRWLFIDASQGQMDALGTLLLYNRISPLFFSSLFSSTCIHVALPSLAILNDRRVEPPVDRSLGITHTLSSKTFSLILSINQAIRPFAEKDSRQQSIIRNVISFDLIYYRLIRKL